MGFSGLRFRTESGRKRRKRRNLGQRKARLWRRRTEFFDAAFCSRRTAWGGQVKESKKKFEKVLMEGKTRELLRKTRENGGI
jgi:hypothetical protein